MTIRDLVEELAQATPTRKDLEMRHAAVLACLREQVCPALVEGDIRAGERFWRELEAARSPSSISEVAQVLRPRR